MSILEQKYPWSKWKKHIALVTDPELAPFLPETAPLEHDSFYVFLRKYPTVFAKPCYGGGGRGVLKLQRCGHIVRIFSTSNRYDIPLEQAYRKVKKLSGENSYIVQQGVDLIQIEGSSIDFRTLLLKTEDSWSFMGMMGKLAVKEQIVTNHCRGGSAITFTDALRLSMEASEDEILELHNKMESLSKRIAETLQIQFPLITELGLDIGIDTCWNPWLIEANTRPQYNLFKLHEDHTLYKRIDGIIRQLRLRPSISPRSAQTPRESALGVPGRSVRRKP